MVHINKLLIGSLITLSTFSVFANKLNSAETNPDNPQVNQEYTIAFKFAVPDDAVRCGLQVEWGDGEVSKYRVGQGQDLSPPFKTSHVYKTPGKMQLNVKGAFIARGLNSVGGCEGGLQGVVDVVDPVEVERLAKEKESFDLKNKSFADEFLKKFEIDPKAKGAKKQIGPSYLSDKAKSSTAFIELSSIKTKDVGQYASIQFEVVANLDKPVTRDNFTYTSYSTNVILFCNDGSGSYGAFSLYQFYHKNGETRSLDSTGKLSGFEQPPSFLTEQLSRKICESARQSGTLKDASDYKKITDLSDTAYVSFDKLSPSMSAQVCDNVESLENSAVASGVFLTRDGSVMQQLVYAGNWKWMGIKKSGKACYVTIEVAGIYKGNSYSQRFICNLGSVLRYPSSSKIKVNTLETCQ